MSQNVVQEVIHSVIHITIYRIRSRNLWRRPVMIIEWPDKTIIWLLMSAAITENN